MIRGHLWDGMTLCKFREMLTHRMLTHSMLTVIFFAVQPNGGNQPSQAEPKKTEVEVLNEDDKKFFSEATQAPKVIYKVQTITRAACCLSNKNEFIPPKQTGGNEGFFPFGKRFFLAIKFMCSHKYDFHNIKLAWISLFIVMCVIKKPSLNPLLCRLVMVEYFDI